MHANPSLALGANLIQLLQRMANFFIKAQMVNILGFEGLIVSVTIICLPLQHKGSYLKYANEFVKMGVPTCQLKCICKSTVSKMVGPGAAHPWLQPTLCHSDDFD